MRRRTLIMGAAATLLSGGAAVRGLGRYFQDEPEPSDSIGEFPKPEAIKAYKTVSCAEAPYDLRPAVNAIMKAIERVSQNLRADQQLIVLIGESHNKPTHNILQQMVLSRLLHRQSDSSNRVPLRFSYGREEPHNSLEFALTNGFGVNVSDDMRSRIQSEDQNGQWSLATDMAVYLPEYAPISSKTLKSFCYQQKISTRFNDLAFDEKNSLDMSDPFTRSVVARYAPEKLDEDIGDGSVEKWELRNIGIVESALEHIKNSNAKIYIQHCGKAHLFGNDNTGEKYSYSLSALFAKTGAAVLPVLLTVANYDEDRIPADAEPVLKDSLVITGMSNRAFNADFRKGSAEYYNKVKSNHEDAFISTVANHSHEEIEIFNFNEQFAYQRKVWRAIRDWTNG